MSDNGRVQGSGFRVQRPDCPCGAALAVAAALAGLAAWAPSLRAAELSEAEIIGQADARIEQHRKADVVLRVLGEDGRPVAEGTRVRIEQTRHAFLFGSNLFLFGRAGDEKLDAEYQRRFAELLNYATLGFYWWHYEPVRGRPRYADTERTLAWCLERHITCKGHPLAWNWVDPRWLPQDPSEAMKLQLARIGDCVGTFKGRIDYWDVVNEATHFDREEPRRVAPILTKAIAEMGVPAYVQSAFKAARQANPEAVLIINDYRTDAEFEEKVLRKLVDADGRPLYDVIGIQSHQHGGAWSAKHTWEVAERFSKYGRPLHFTETTLVSGALARQRGPGPWESTPEGEKRQAEEVARFYTVLFSHPAVEAVTWWDFSDRGAWQGAPAGFLRKDMSPKPAYDALKALIKGRWWTKQEAVVGADGEVRFRGFLGAYRITVDRAPSPPDASRPLTGTFSVDKRARGPIEVRTGLDVPATAPVRTRE
ncbi:MAG: endo-1,4-beta-xylanase [Phycisphaerae bacterium]|jgi:GH35 family endo-1,4-beta-xylanase